MSWLKSAFELAMERLARRSDDSLPPLRPATPAPGPPVVTDEPPGPVEVQAENGHSIATPRTLGEGLAAIRPVAEVSEHHAGLGPRADFSCTHCETVYDNLPVSSTRCPVCGFKRGFKRLYDGVNVSTKGHRIAKFIDPQMTAACDVKAARTSAAKAFESQYAAAADRMLAQAPPEVRAAAAANPNFRRPMQTMAPASAMAMLPPEARAASRELNIPVARRHVVPNFSK